MVRIPCRSKVARRKSSPRCQPHRKARLFLEPLETRVTPAKIGYYEMGTGQGVPDQVPPILTAGDTPVQLFGLSPADLAGIDVLDVQNPDNNGYGSDYTSHLADIQSAVSAGMVLVVHDRHVDNAGSILPGGGSFSIIRDFTDGSNIDVLDDSTLVTHGPGGTVDNSTLDGGNFSSHGYAIAGSLPGSAALILSQTDPTHVVTFAYGYGAGTVIYSSIPLDFYLSVGGNNFSDIYAPNVLAYAATNPLGGLSVTGTDPANGSVVFTKPTQYVVNVSSPLIPGTVDASDFQVNGVSATGVSYTAGTTSLTFTFASDPVTAQGLQTMHVAAGAFNRVSDGGGVKEFNGTFRYDAVLMQVTSTSPAVGSTITLPATTLDLNFNEAYDPASAQAGDFTLNQGSVSGVSPVSATTLRLTLSGVTAEGTLTVNMAAGAMTDVYGNPGAAFSGSYTLDFGTFPFPTPLHAVAPAGSLVYAGSQVGIIQTPGDTDSFTILVDPGQKITLTVDPASTLQPVVELYRGNKLLGSATAGSAGLEAVLQSVATQGQLGATGPGPTTYTVTVRGAGGTTGGYTVQMVLNAAVESASHDGATDNTRATAQGLEPAFLTFNAAVNSSQAAPYPGSAAVLGRHDQFAVSTLFSADFESGLQGFTIDNTPPSAFYRPGLWHLSTGRGTQPGHSASQSLYYGVGEGPDGGGSTSIGSFNPTTGGIISPAVALPTGGALLLDFNYVLQTRGFPSDVDFATLQINNGSGWTFLKEYDRVAESSSWRTSDPVDLTAYAGQTVQLRWSFDTVRGPRDRSAEGWYVDDVRIRQFVPVPDYYSFTLKAGESATVALTNLSAGNLSLSLENAAGTTLATGTTGATNVSRIISDFVAPAAGTYYVRVAGTNVNGIDYSLLVTRNADFDTEGNDNFASAQNVLATQVAGRQWVLGDFQGRTFQLINNGSFETGDFTGWNVATTGLPFVDWTVSGAGAGSGFFPPTSPQDGTFDAWNGFDGAGPMQYTMSQDVTIPAGAPVGLLTWQDRVQWDFALTGTATQPRTYEVEVLDPGTNAVLATLFSFSTGTAHVVGDTGWQTHTADLSAFKGSTVRLLFREDIPETFTGPGQIEFDGISLSYAETGDFYKVALAPGKTLEAATSTPGAGAGAFDNTFDPMIRVFDASGHLVASDDNSGPDGRNALVSYTVPAGAGGTYYVEILPSPATAQPTSGEYILTVKGNTAGKSQYLDGDPTTGAGAAPPVSAAALQEAVARAIAYWNSQGVDTSALKSISVTTADLVGSMIGHAFDGAIVIDANAAGHGWSLGGGGPAGTLDLFETVEHEMGHVLGFEHTDANPVMQATLSPNAGSPVMAHVGQSSSSTPSALVATADLAAVSRGPTGTPVSSAPSPSFRPPQGDTRAELSSPPTSPTSPPAAPASLLHPGYAEVPGQAGDDAVDLRGQILLGLFDSTAEARRFSGDLPVMPDGPAGELALALANGELTPGDSAGGQVAARASDSAPARSSVVVNSGGLAAAWAGLALLLGATQAPEQETRTRGQEGLKGRRADV